MTLEHKTSLKLLEYVCSNSQKCILWVKMIDLSFMPNIIRILSIMFQEDIFHRKYIKTMHCQELYLGNFKSDFDFFFASSDSRFSNSCISAKYCSVLTNNTSMERFFIQL